MDEGRHSDARPGADRKLIWVDLLPVYDAPDEASAIHVRTLLQSAGMAARIRSAQVPAFDGALASGVGFWGQVMVAAADEPGARTLVEAFLREVEPRSAE